MGYLGKFDELLRSLQDGRFDVNENGNIFSVSFSINPPASDVELDHCEKELGIMLPPTFRMFLHRYNGCVLYNYDNIDGYKILGTQDLKTENECIRSYNEGYFPEEILVFALCIGEGSFLGFRTGNTAEYEVVDCYMDGTPEEWTVIESSFSAFLDKLIDYQGRKYYLL